MTEDGSIYVWIPRYSYKIVSGYHKAVKSWNSDFVDGTEDEIGKIEIKFSDGVKDDTLDGFRLHPAFTFGEDELLGFWFAKYTASRLDATESFYGYRDIASFRPNVQMWRNITIYQAVEYAYKVNREMDSHLVKNIEWGAVAYLTNAIGRIPYINPSDDYITGIANETQEGEFHSKKYLWNTPEGVKASTTHNIYGIYDMSGGAKEYVFAYYSGHNNYQLKQFNKYEEKYKDVYNNVYSDDEIGNDLWEIIENTYDACFYSWDNDGIALPYYSLCFITRGGEWGLSSGSGIFSFHYTDGKDHGDISFRVVLPVKYIA